MGEEEVVQSVGFSRRSFVKKLLAVGFAVPVVSSFALDAIEGGSAQGGVYSGNQTQFSGNQTFNVLPHGHTEFHYGPPEGSQPF